MDILFLILQVFVFSYYFWEFKSPNAFLEDFRLFCKLEIYLKFVVKSFQPIPSSILQICWSILCSPIQMLIYDIQFIASFKYCFSINVVICIKDDRNAHIEELLRILSIILLSFKDCSKDVIKLYQQRLACLYFKLI